MNGEKVLTTEDARFFRMNLTPDWRPIAGLEGEIMARDLALRRVKQELEHYCNEIDSLVQSLRKMILRRDWP